MRQPHNCAGCHSGEAKCASGAGRLKVFPPLAVQGDASVVWCRAMSRCCVVQGDAQHLHPTTRAQFASIASKSGNAHNTYTQTHTSVL